MEFPFKYTIFLIVKMLYTRNMSLTIERIKLVDFFVVLIKKLCCSSEEIVDITDKFNFSYELDDLLKEYFQYFDYDGEYITFDIDYIDDLEELILFEQERSDMFLTHMIDFFIDNDTAFLEIMGIKMKNELYNYLFEIEREIEEKYFELCDVDCECILDKDRDSVVKRIKELTMKKVVMLVNIDNLLSDVEKVDFAHYAENMALIDNAYVGVDLLLYDENFSDAEMINDPFQRSIFTFEDSCKFNLMEKINSIAFKDKNYVHYGKLKFYLTFLDILEKEIEDVDSSFKFDLMTIKYRLMNTIDTVYDMTLFMNDNDRNKKVNVNDYLFAEYEVYYLINEVLEYSDDIYTNDNKDDRYNLLLYFDNLIKKIFIETYYVLTNDKKVIDSIKSNSNYGVSTISSSLLDDIIRKPKIRIKENGKDQ